jgi:hypothetical protein
LKHARERVLGAGAADLLMNDEAFRMLDAIARGEPNDSAAGLRWTRAFQTIRWVTQPGVRPALTSEGAAAHRELAQARQRAPRAASA